MRKVAFWVVFDVVVVGSVWLATQAYNRHMINHNARVIDRYCHQVMCLQKAPNGQLVPMYLDPQPVPMPQSQPTDPSELRVQEI